MESIMTTRYKGEQTGLHYASAELIRRGYLVSLTSGKAKDIDMLVISPNRNTFSVDVKGGVSNNYFLPIRRKASIPNHYYIIVYAPWKKDKLADGVIYSPPKFYILTSEEAQKKIEKGMEEWWSKQPPQVHEKYKKKYGATYREAWAGINIRDLEEGRWDKLPQ